MILDKNVEAVTAGSPFHSGEQEMQERAGKLEAMKEIGPRAIRSFMPDQHRDFYSQLPFVLVGSVDSDGWPWASFIAGEPGFLQSPDPTTLLASAKPDPRDPLVAALLPGNPLGLLGIELPTRRRNRVNVTVGQITPAGISMEVVQSFGNCPQYIHKRSVEFVPESAVQRTPAPAQAFASFDVVSRALIEASDTLFVSSYLPVTDKPKIQGVDISHRGGKKGFVKVTGNTLTVPDYAGNNFFNTLGNFLINPKAGLLFADFENGNVLQLTGTVELLNEDDPEILAFKGAHRGWRFTLNQGQLLEGALPFRTAFQEYSRHVLVTGDWQ